ncbi:MAG: PrsW family glutamic-type intramembrane protease [Dehalococcoidia bacterium]|nr:PrsW family glutamic-type intramembrane protease [Dehalococcoidia bacterium]
MQFLTILILAFAPGIFWMWLIYRWDRYQPEPRWLVIRTFIFGMLAVIPIAIVELALVLGGPGIEALQQLGQGGLSLGDIAYEAFVVAGMTEELGKFLVMRLAVYRSPYFDESTDGIIYSSAVALGFATLENVGYTLTYGWQVILSRGPISTLAHVLFSVVWGYPLALRKIQHPRATFYLWLGVLGGTLAHGFFDFFLFTQSWYAALVFPLILGMIIALNAMLRHSRRISAFQHKVAELHADCPNCATRTPVYASFCPSCGIQMTGDKVAKNCGNCGAPVANDAGYCTACGSRIVKKPRDTK